MTTERIQFNDDGKAQWAGMADYVLVSPNGQHQVLLPYEGEPPHGDSYHRIVIDGRAFPGLAWGCFFAFSPCSRYLPFSWMAKAIERRTVVVDLQTRRYFVLPDYLYDFKIAWPTITGEGDLSSGKAYTFNGNEQWIQN